MSLITWLRKILLGLAFVAMPLGITACAEDVDDDGIVDEVDEGADDLGDEIEEGVEDLGDEDLEAD